jgi:hypothetical protein
MLRRPAEGGDLREALEQVLAAVSDASQCESVGIRWKAGEDYPYFVTRGFGRDFVVTEGPLCSRDGAGTILRYPDGSPQLACMCGAVVSGRTDPALPIFTEAGSFWANGTSELLRSPSLGSPAGIVTRNYCNAVGYESVALIPLRKGDGILGLLQLNSRRPDRFTAEQIEEYEGIARAIAEAMSGRLAEQPPA